MRCASDGEKAAAVFQALVAGGGSLIDTSSVCGDAEAVLVAESAVPGITAVTRGLHMTDNLGAMRGPLPDPDQHRRMEEFVASL